MAARNRPRGGPAKDDPADAKEERNIWDQIVGDMKRLKTINTRAAEVSKQIIELEDSMGVDGAPSVSEIDQLQALYREGVKLAEEESKILKEEPNGVVQNIGILSALRVASESDPPRSSTQLKSRNQKRKFETDSNVDSPAASPNVSTSASRLKGSVSRSGSVPATRESRDSLVKTEEGADGIKTTAAEKAGQLTRGAEVAYKPNRVKGGQEGDWIQCIILNVTGEGKHKRYEVQDPEPDEHGQPGAIFRTTAAALIPIPSPGTSLPDYPKGKQVLARYPETTTFYRAEVVGMKKDICRLKFEGEEETNQEMILEVDRRYVLDVGGK